MQFLAPLYNSFLVKMTLVALAGFCMLVSCVEMTNSRDVLLMHQFSNSSSVSCSVTCSNSSSCAPGVFCRDGCCKCGDKYPDVKVKCSDARLSVLRNYCVTFDEDANMTFAGDCLHSIKYPKKQQSLLYHQLPQASLELNDTMCKSLNRTGTLCGRCLPDHYPLAYSFNMTCIPCPHARWNWFRYTMAAYIPLTLFYLVILFFRINVTSSYLFPVVYYCQDLATPLVIRHFDLLLDANSNYSIYIMSIKVLASMYGIWNLDFFRAFYDDFCLGIGILPTLALDYVIAVYPLFLMMITYFLITLYDNNYRVVTIMWTPFRKLLSIFKRNWNVRTSLIDAFVTFFFLSNVKFLSVSCDLLQGIKIYKLYPDHYNYTLGLFYAADVKYLSRDEHLPYAILAIISLFFFVFLPTLILTLYPFSLFQKFLNLFPFRWYILHTFVDSFCGCYKNGTQPGTRDYRWFASAFLILRLGHFIVYCLFDDVISPFIAALSLMLLASLVAAFQPFSSSLSHYNAINVVFLLFLAATLIAGSGAFLCLYMAPQYMFVFYILVSFLAAAPIMCVLAVSSYWSWKFGVRIFSRIKARVRGYSHIPGNSARMDHSPSYSRENLSSFVSYTKYNN